jgi:deoxyribose-phosphate aldolase
VSPARTRTQAPPPPTAEAAADHADGTDPASWARDLIGAARLDNRALHRFLHGLPGVDEVGATARAAALATRSIKAGSKQFALDLAVRMVDLTTLEGSDTPGTVRSLCAKAVRPDPEDDRCPPVAAVCVYNDLVPIAVHALAAAGPRPGYPRVKVAAVATAFPSGRASRAVKLADTRDAAEAGADEIDMVIDRGAFLSGRYLEVFESIAAVRQACARRRAPAGTEPGPAHLKVILETGELASYDNVRRASWLAMLAGADFIKTSTGKISPAATLPVTLVMLEAVRDWHELTGAVIGVKPAGGIRTAKDAVRHLVMVNETAGPAWLDPDRYRFGASSLLNDLLLQRRRIAIGAYAGSNHLTLAT